MSAQITRVQEFNRAIQRDKGVAVLFYSSWCFYCKRFMPVFEKYAVSEDFARVCTDDMPELEDIYSIDVVPTVLYFKKGKVECRLDGALGRGLTEEQLKDMLSRCVTDH